MTDWFRTDTRDKELTGFAPTQETRISTDTRDKECLSEARRTDLISVMRSDLTHPKP
jgi:hypothetical protein